VFIDESAANERTLDRKFGWAPVGYPSQEIRPAKRSQRWSILPAYTLDGYITYDIVHGFYNAELFNDFIQNKVLPLCNAYPGPRSILVMDNARIHQPQVQKHSYIFDKLIEGTTKHVSSRTSRIKVFTSILA